MKLEALQEDLKKALLSRDVMKSSVLRLLLSAIKNKDIELGRALSEEEILKLIQAEDKKIQDSIEQFGLAGRNDLVEKSMKEKEILSVYLPKKADESDVRSFVADFIKKSEITSPSEFGKVMGATMGHFGASADGKVVSKIVKELLG